MKDTIFITGGTGLLGSFIVRELCRSGRHENIDKIILLSRDKGTKNASQRVYSILDSILSESELIIANKLIKIISGDIAVTRFGLSSDDYDSLASEVSVIYHSAALAEFSVDLETIRKINVGGTCNVLDLARSCKRLRQLNHIGTVGIAGNTVGYFNESDYNVGQKFNNTYEQSKFEAEGKVREAIADKIPAVIYRPAIITGDSVTGFTNNFKMFYQPLHLFNLGLFKVLPADAASTYSICPVDITAKAIVDISFSNDVKVGDVYHVANEHIIDFDFFVNISAKFFDFKIPTMVPIEQFDFTKLTPLQKNLISAYLPYFNYRVKFSTERAQAVLSKSGLNWPIIDEKYFQIIFSFCLNSGFIAKRKRL